MMIPSSLHAGATSLTPGAAWSSSNHHPHSVQFYGDDAFLLDGLSRFIGAALQANEAGVVFATPAHREGLAARLQARGLDVAEVVSQERYIVLDAEETLALCLRDGRPDPARFARVVGDVIEHATAGAQRRVAIFGELVALLYAEGKSQAAIEIEHLWNDLARTHQFSLHCAYPLSVFGRAEDSASLQEICAAHSHVVPAENYVSLRTEDERLRAIALLQQKQEVLKCEIEERRRLEEALRERNRELAAAVAARDEFLSVAAHELKTPVTVLRAYAQLLLRDARRERPVGPERLASALDAIEQQTGKLHQLVTRLLDTAQIESGKLRIEPVATDLAALVHAALARQRTNTTHDLRYVGPEQLETMVDPLRFEQVLTNLLDNAAKFSPEGGAVTVELAQDDARGVQLSVTDQGIGIPAEQREVIFDRFYQGQGSRHLSGLGLGLYISSEIVALHGGAIHIEEPEQGGARFVVALPPLSGRAAESGTLMAAS
jgi:signal transduction histidine kinase